MQEESVWLKGLRFFAWINLIMGVIVGFVTANQLAETFAGFYQDKNWGIFFIALISIIIIIFIITAVIMVYLDMAADISATRLINYDMYTILIKDEAKPEGAPAETVKHAKSVACGSCNRPYDSSYSSCPHCGYRPGGGKPSLSSIAAKSTPASTDAWVCPHCDEKNPASSRMCKGCGKYK